MKKKFIIVGIIFIIIIAIVVNYLLNVVPMQLKKSKFEEMFNDTSILTNGYTIESGLTYLSISYDGCSIEYDLDSDRINGTTTIVDDKTLKLDFEDGVTVTCSVLKENILDCGGAVFRRYDGGYDDDGTCELSEEDRKQYFSDGYDGIYNNPYDKVDDCYRAYDEQYATGVFNAEEADRRTEEALKHENGCLGLGGQCYNPRR